MLYRDIMKKLIRAKGDTLETFAKSIGSSQAKLSMRLKDSWNPGMKDAQDMLDELGYEIAFLPKGTVEKSTRLKEIGYVPEFPDRPQKNS